MNVQQSFPVKQFRSKPVKGGKATCSRCDSERLPGSAYCRKHKNEYQAAWSRARTATLRELEGR